MKYKEVPEFLWKNLWKANFWSKRIPRNKLQYFFGSWKIACKQPWKFLRLPEVNSDF